MASGRTTATRRETGTSTYKMVFNTYRVFPLDRVLEVPLFAPRLARPRV